MTKPLAHFDGSALTVEAGAYCCTITVREILGAWDALSHHPERRAGLELAALGERLDRFAEHVDELARKGGEIHTEELERFARRHVALTRAFWQAESQCMSWFIVGPAKFPTARNAKRQDSRDKAAVAVREHLAAARKATERRAFPHGAPGGPIRASNPEAPALLRRKIERRRRAHELMKAANAAIRAARSDDVEALAHAVVEATGWSQALAARIVQRDEMGRRGFQSWSLSNALAEIKRLELRLGEIEASRERGSTSTTVATSAGTVELVEDVEAARIQLFFEGKPDEATRRLLKGRGFRWSPRAGAWQRHLNNAGRHAAGYVLQQLGREEGGA